MITKKIGWIGCGNMGGAILHGALKSGVLAKENAMVYDVSPAAMEKGRRMGRELGADCADVCRNSDLILLAVKPQYAEQTLAQCRMPGRQGSHLHRGRRHGGEIAG